MPIDFGTIVILLAVLIFYGRLIRIQRERARQMNRQPSGKRKPSEQSSAPVDNLSILSRKRLNRVIAGAGALAIIVGVLLYLNLLPIPGAEQYGWAPVAAGILAFSWGFE